MWEKTGFQGTGVSGKSYENRVSVTTHVRRERRHGQSSPELSSSCLHPHQPLRQASPGHRDRQGWRAPRVSAGRREKKGGWAACCFPHQPSDCFLCSTPDSPRATCRLGWL